LSAKKDKGPIQVKIHKADFSHATFVGFPQENKAIKYFLTKMFLTLLSFLN